MPTRLDYANLSLMDALDLAILIEDEAYERYKFFATQIGHRYPGDAASAFSEMAKNEAAHGTDLLKRRKELFGEKPARVTRNDLFDVEAPDVGAPRTNMSALQAWELALDSEQKALHHYQRALPHVTNPKIKALFEELRDEEIEHVRMVRAAIEALPPEARVEIEEDEDELGMY